MATISTQQAVERLKPEIQEAPPDDLVEIHNELFPEKRATEDDANKDPGALVRKVLAHIDAGLEAEEIVDLWNVIFPTHRRVWFNEEEELIHYDPKGEPVGRAE